MLCKYSSKIETHSIVNSYHLLSFAREKRGGEKSRRKQRTVINVSSFCSPVPSSRKCKTKELSLRFSPSIVHRSEHAYITRQLHYVHVYEQRYHIRDFGVFSPVAPKKVSVIYIVHFFRVSTLMSTQTSASWIYIAFVVLHIFAYILRKRQCFSLTFVYFLNNNVHIINKIKETFFVTEIAQKMGLGMEAEPTAAIRSEMVSFIKLMMVLN